MNPSLEQAWQLARQRYADIDVNVEQALALLDTLPVSMHCWQGDDVAGFEDPSCALTGGIKDTGNYPCKATNAQQLRADLKQAFSLIPGPKRLNLHAIYLEAEQLVERNAIELAHFARWVAWAREHQRWDWTLIRAAFPIR